ncbi:MAG: hypothetical protein WKF75_05390 [Singulisphaera sp.]
MALGAKCGTFGASGSPVAAAAEAEADGTKLPPSREFSATAPRPTPHSWKNQRRVTCIRRSLRKWSLRVMARPPVILW